MRNEGRVIILVGTKHVVTSTLSQIKAYFWVMVWYIMFCIDQVAVAT